MLQPEMDAADRLDVSAPAGDPAAHFTGYAQRLRETLSGADWSGVAVLAHELRGCWEERRKHWPRSEAGRSRRRRELRRLAEQRRAVESEVGSAGNAMHLANDFLYGISKRAGSGLKVNALPSNGSVISCLANDEGYEHIFSMQLEVLAHPDDVLIVFSGSGNSPNILRALEQARQLGMRSYAVLGYSGGRAKSLADVSIHFPVDDMQISEDMQLVVGHMIMQWLFANQPGKG